MSGTGEHLREWFRRAFADCAHQQTVPSYPFRAPSDRPQRGLRGDSLAQEAELLALGLSRLLKRHEREGRDALKILGVPSDERGVCQECRCRNRTISRLDAILAAQVCRNAGQA